MDWILLSVLGLVSGTITALFGLGGGIVIIPALTLMNYEITQAVGISIIQMVFASFVGTLLNLRKKAINLQPSVLLSFGGIIGSSFSGMVLATLSSRTLYLIFLFFLCYSFYYKCCLGKKRIYVPKSPSLLFQILILVPSGCIVGVFSSSLGVGGVLLFVPLLGYFLGLNPKQIAPIGLFFICFSSFSGAISLYKSGFVQIDQALILTVFSMISVVFGTHFLQKIKDTSHEKILIFIYLFAICNIIIKII